MAIPVGRLAERPVDLAHLVRKDRQRAARVVTGERRAQLAHRRRRAGAGRGVRAHLPEDGYRVSYHSMPLTPDEMRAQREDITAKMSAGLISPVQAVMMMYDDMDDREAREYLLQIRRERAEFL